MSANLATSRIQDAPPVIDVNLAERENKNAIRYGFVTGGWPVLPLDHHTGQFFVGPHLLTRRMLIPFAGQYCGERDDRGLQDENLDTFLQRLRPGVLAVPPHVRYKTAWECAYAVYATMQHNNFVVLESLTGLGIETTAEAKVNGVIQNLRHIDSDRVLQVFNAVAPNTANSLVEFRAWLASGEALGTKGSIALAKLDKDLKARATALHEELLIAANRAFKELTSYVNQLHSDVTKYYRTGNGKQGLSEIEVELFREIGHALPERNAADDEARQEMANTVGQGQANSMAMIQALVDQNKLQAEAQAEQNRQFMELAKQNQELLSRLTPAPGGES